MKVYIIYDAITMGFWGAFFSSDKLIRGLEPSKSLWIWFGCRLRLRFWAPWQSQRAEEQKVLEPSWLRLNTEGLSFPRGGFLKWGTTKSSILRIFFDGKPMVLIGHPF
jgi:hypothetical protein